MLPTLDLRQWITSLDYVLTAADAQKSNKIMFSSWHARHKPLNKNVTACGCNAQFRCTWSVLTTYDRWRNACQRRHYFLNNWRIRIHVCLAVWLSVCLSVCLSVGWSVRVKCNECFRCFRCFRCCIIVTSMRCRYWCHWRRVETFKSQSGC